MLPGAPGAAAAPTAPPDAAGAEAAAPRQAVRHHLPPHARPPPDLGVRHEAVDAKGPGLISDESLALERRFTLIDRHRFHGILVTLWLRR
jgi:hypothetical protein